LCVALGARITGVDDHTFSSTGESYSMISESHLSQTRVSHAFPRQTYQLTLPPIAVLPNSNTANTKNLQADNVSLAYEFAKKVRSFLFLVHSPRFSLSFSTPPACICCCLPCVCLVSALCLPCVCLVSALCLPCVCLVSAKSGFQIERSPMYPFPLGAVVLYITPSRSLLCDSFQGTRRRTSARVSL
jgi:hypothetical protein